MASMFLSTLPVMQAPIGGSVSPELVAAVASAGGLGTFPCRAPTQLATDIASLRSLAGNVPFAVNLLGKTNVAAQVEVILDLHVPVAHWSWGVQPDQVAQFRRQGVYCTAQVGSAAAAASAEAAGVDALIVQGVEAGGGIEGELPRDELLRTVLANAMVPVAAAGGIASEETAAQVRRRGAQGVMAGTVFVATPESRSHPIWIEQLVRAQPDDTVVSLLFSEGDPSYRQRTLRSRVVQEWIDAGSSDPGRRPGEAEVVADYYGQRIHRYADVPPLQGMSGTLDLLQMPAGQGVGAMNTITPAAEVVRKLDY